MKDQFKVEVPAHNKDCAGCLERALQITKILEVLDMLSAAYTNAQNLISSMIEDSTTEETANDLKDLRETVNDIDKRLLSIEELLTQATGAGKAMKWMTKILWAMGGAIVAMIGLKGSPVFQILHSFTGYMSK